MKDHELWKEQHEIWRSRLDDRFDVYVMQSDANGYVGRLVIEEGDELVLLDERVGIMYGAPFGPDMDDVKSWQLRATDVVDHYVNTGSRPEWIDKIEPGDPDRIQDEFDTIVADLYDVTRRALGMGMAFQDTIYWPEIQALAQTFELLPDRASGEEESSDDL